MGEGLGMDLTTNCAYRRKPYKIPEVQGSESFKVGKHIHTGRATHPDSIGPQL